MSHRPRHYFLAPTATPSEGPIRLGNIVSHPRQADDAINEDSVPLQSFLPGMDILEHNEYNYTLALDTKRGGHIGIWASFLQMLGVGGDVKGEISTETSEQWQCEKLQTISFTPSLAYMRKCLEDPGVQNYMRVNKPWLGLAYSRLFIVTGVKIAHGAAATVHWARKRNLHLHFGLDLGVLGAGVPLQVGPDVGLGKSVEIVQSHDSATPFVFAFRLRRMKISKKGAVEHRQYDKGTMLGIHDEGRRGEEELQVTLEGIEDEDTDGGVFQLQSVDAVDESTIAGDSCKCSVVT